MRPVMGARRLDETQGSWKSSWVEVTSDVS